MNIITLKGNDYVEKVQELEARGNLISKVLVGRTNSEWILHWHDGPQPAQREIGDQNNLETI